MHNDDDVLPTGHIASSLALSGGYATSQSILSILKINRYETKAKKTAGWNNTAKQRLRATRHMIVVGYVPVSNYPYGLLVSVYIHIVPCRTYKFHDSASSHPSWPSTTSCSSPRTTSPW